MGQRASGGPWRPTTEVHRLLPCNAKNEGTPWCVCSKRHGEPPLHEAVAGAEGSSSARGVEGRRRRFKVMGTSREDGPSGPLGGGQSHPDPGGVLLYESKPTH